MSEQTIRLWVVIARYPAWPSPYFAQLHRWADAALNLHFIADLPAVARLPDPPGVVNLHRLKRLYQEPNGARTAASAEAFLAELSCLHAQGWRVVWTVHNLLPIDGDPPGPVDHRVLQGVLALADTVICHTRADADHLRTLTRAPVIAAGWGSGIPAAQPGSLPGEVATLTERMRRVPTSVLALGNITSYKGMPEVMDAFVAHTRTAHLFVVGPCGKEVSAHELTRRAHASGGRVHLYLARIAPEHVDILFRAATIALCPYRTDGPWEFFTRVCRPASVITAVAAGCPVIAPDLPAVREITTDCLRWLYPPQKGSGEALSAAEDAGITKPPIPAAGDHIAGDWAPIAAQYLRIASSLF